MSKSKKVLLSVGAAVATRKLVRLFSDLELDDLLRPIGLSRRRSHWGENLALLGVGAAIGGVAALLMAPASGKETRARIEGKLNALGESVTRHIEESAELVAVDSNGARINFSGAHVPS